MTGQYHASEAPKTKLERAIYTALRTPPNTIAGRPNAGNLALLHIHKGRVLPKTILESYCRHALRVFLPELEFTVTADPTSTGEYGDFQGVIVRYERGI